MPGSNTETKNQIENDALNSTQKIELHGKKRSIIF